MLPMGTVPNALDYSKGHFSQIDMVQYNLNETYDALIKYCNYKL